MGLRYRILYLEDDKKDVDLLRDLLDAEACLEKMVAVDNRQDFEAALRDGTFDIILVDYNLPDFDGLSALRISLEYDPDIPVVLISGTVGEEVAIEALKEGATNYVLKDRLMVTLLPVFKKTIDEAKEKRKRKGAERALLESEERYRSLFENSRDAIVMTRRDGKVIDANQAFLDLFGYTRDEALALRAEGTYLNPGEREEFFKAIEAKGYVKDYELRLKKKDGAQLVCLSSATVQYDNDGVVTGFQVITRDITDRKRLEEQLHQAQKMEAIGTLAGGIAHDFNNLLAVIQGQTSFIEMGLGEKRLFAENIADIHQAVKRGAALTRQLLGFAAEGKYEVKPVDLKKLIQMSSQMFGRTRKELQIFHDYEKNIWTVDADQGQIEQVLLNLYTNAAQAMPRGGQLNLGTEDVTLEESQVKAYGVRPGRYVKVTVTDTGEGMDEETQKKIFNPFFTTKGPGKGSGLGLASAYGIVKNHQGIIEVESALGEGTTFTIYLPASEKKVEKEQEQKPEAPTKGEGTILLVDDEELIIRAAQANLLSLGHEVLIAQSGEEALKIYQEKKETIDLVILDMIMPDMGGGKTYDRLKEIDPEVKVLLASGYSIDGQAREILDRGCNGFIQKPFESGELAQKIVEILGKK